VPKRRASTRQGEAGVRSTSMRTRARWMLAACAWVVLGVLGLSACWDPATLDTTTSDLSTGGPDAGPDVQTPDASIDAPVVCPPPTVPCGTMCVDPANDPLNCGGCGVSCLLPPPPPACEGTNATLYGPGICVAAACTFVKSAVVDCAPMNRTCAAGQCTACVTGFQDNDLDGSCTPDCTTAALNCNGNGACSDATGTAACVCDPGFTGADCSVNIDDCALAPCQNGGMCVDGIASYTCICVGGYSGANCEVSPVTPVGLAAHYDARNAGSLTLGGANDVMAWADLSGNGVDLTPNGTAPVYNAALINGVPALDFTGGAGMISSAFNLTSDVTVFAVFQYGTPGQWGAIAHHGSRDNDWSMEENANSGTGFMHFQSVNDNTGVELPFSTGTAYIAVGRITGVGAGAERYFSSTSTLGGTMSVVGTGSSITTGSKAMYVGTSDNNESSNAYIGELIYYTRSLSDAERDAIISYLQAGWGI
jgi:hypothetical protein